MRSGWALAFILIGVAAAETPDAERCFSQDPEVAIAGCTAMLRSGHETRERLIRALSNRGGAYLRKRQYDRAIHDLDQAIVLDPKSAPAFQTRGTAYSLEGQNDRAIQDFNEAIQLDPKSAASFYARGGVYNVQGQYDRAIQDFDQAIGLKPNLGPVFFAATYRERGLAYFGKGQYKRAIQDYDQAIRLYPKLTQASTDRDAALRALRPPVRDEAEVAKAKPLKPSPLKPSLPAPAKVEETTSVELKPAPLPVAPEPVVTAGDLQQVTAGMSRQQVLKLGPPAARITMDDDGHLSEIFQYSANGMSLGTVRLTDGTVSSVQIH
jgi:tetratricopeptide (TPR) repeat protein